VRTRGSLPHRTSPDLRRVFIKIENWFITVVKRERHWDSIYFNGGLFFLFELYDGK
jgi:hypothetical protein